MHFGPLPSPTVPGQLGMPHYVGSHMPPDCSRAADAGLNIDPQHGIPHEHPPRGRTPPPAPAPLEPWMESQIAVTRYVSARDATSPYNSSDLPCR